MDFSWYHCMRPQHNRTEQLLKAASKKKKEETLQRGMDPGGWGKTLSLGQLAAGPHSFNAEASHHHCMYLGSSWKDCSIFFVYTINRTCQDPYAFVASLFTCSVLVQQLNLGHIFLLLSMCLHFFSFLSPKSYPRLHMNWKEQLASLCSIQALHFIV